MHKAIDVAKWFLARNSRDNDANGDNELITNLKLQKLLYYAQGVYLAMKGEPLFSDPIEAWTHGPVVPDVYRAFSMIDDGMEKRSRGAAGIEFDEPFDFSQFDDETNAILEEVFSHFGQYSAWKLREMTHAERPWRKTDLGAVIQQGEIRSYFLEEIVE